MTQITFAGLNDGTLLGFPLFPTGITKMLRDEKCWIVTGLTNENGKLLKPPLPGFEPRNPATWKTFKDAVEYAASMYETGNYDGCYPACIIPDGFIVVDLDNHTGQDNEKLDALYNGIIQPFNGGFIEKSISGRGWHITGQAIWDSTYSLTAKSDEGINIQIRQPGGYILLTGNLHQSGQPQIVNIESFLPVLHDYFKESLIPDGAFEEAGLGMTDKEVLDRVNETLPNVMVQLMTSLRHGPTQAFGEFADTDNTNRWYSCFRGLYDICRDPEQVYRIVVQSPVGKWENRPDSKVKNYNTPDKYYKFTHEQVIKSCARAAASKADLSDVELNLDPEKEWAPKDRTAELPENEARDHLSAYTFYQSAPGNMQLVLDHLTGDNPKKRDMMMDYAIAAALTMAGLATGKTRTVNFDGYENFIQPALVVLGASGTGKSTVTSFINRVRAKAVNHSRPALMHKTTEQTTHPRNISNYLEEMSLNPNRGFILQFDEATSLFGAMNTRNFTDFQQYILSAMMERKKSGFLAGQARAKAENSTKPASEPCFGILAASVEETLMKVIGHANIVDGTVSRFLFIPDAGMTMQARTKEEILAERLAGSKKSDVPDDIMVIYEQMAGKGSPQPEVDVNIKFANLADYVDYVWEIERLVEKYQQDFAMSSFFQRFGLHWSHLVGCLAMYEDPSNPVITRQHCDWAFKYVLRCIQGIARRLTSFATEAIDDSDVAKNIVAVVDGIIKTYGRNKDFEAVRQDYPAYVKKAKSPGVTAVHLDSKAFAESVFTANASRFVSKDFKGDRKKIVSQTLEMLVGEGYMEKQSLQFGGRPGTFYVVK